ncbi:hypothetical protein HHL23_13555 [Chryseobacterium sp. RP-3-3]|uniref:Uncharacterized protein n=1 Tax=Chryseobacterium antibioticum TaxID=2728847 RepID=A0A7Y0FS29_9FLAO|nr:hypothetical protein [Chryseobacterium antibioticum]NML70813.1 hypothetical protein [Chryseobacterium antibioticum]
MKKIVLIITVFSSAIAMAQIAIGKSELSKIQPANTVTNPSISLEFYDNADNTKGLVLPWTSTVINQPIAYNSTTEAGYRGMQGTVVDGTIIFDLSDKKVKYMKNGTWSALTGALPLIAGATTYSSFNAVDSSLQDSKKEGASAKAAIGGNSTTDTTAGILVLTDANRAMVLPKVASPHLNIKNPTPGLMAYDTTKKQLAVYNGTVWSFWKP